MASPAMIRAALVSFAMTIVALLAPAVAQTPTPFGTTIEVSRILTEVRVHTRQWHPSNYEW
jgi:hypothetical protein